ncbi:MAG: lipoprotein-releasing ABC transporter permease subunit [Myxococcota bacterium]|nr:lipoprotein-releasing ABC transporter permease subunit [Myxococcota bacterium]
MSPEVAQPTLLASLWEAAQAAGGSFALSFIVALALGIVANTALFLGSSVVVLERFARATRSLTSLVLATFFWVAGLAALGTGVESVQALADLSAELELGWQPGPFGAWLVSAGSLLLLTVFCELFMALLLRLVPPLWLGLGATAMLAGGATLWIGGLDRLPYAVLPAALSVGVAAFLRIRRVRRGEPRAGADERLSVVLALTLCAGAVVPLLLPAPAPAISGLGVAVTLVFLTLVVLGLLPLATAGLIDVRGTAEWFVATRYLFAKRRQTFVSIITVICIAGVAVGVWLIITVLSVMNGFERVWREEIIGNRAHFTVQSPLGPIADYEALIERIDEVEDVTGASPFVDGEGMVRGARGEIVGVRLRGIDPVRVGSVTDLADDLLPGSEGALERLSHSGNGDGSDPGIQSDPGILVGSQLANLVGASIGDEIVLISPFGGPPTPLGPGPRLKRFQVAGIFQSSFFQYDEIYTYTTLAAAQDFRRVDDVVHGIEVRTTDYYRSQSVGRAVESLLGFPYYTRDWKEFFPAFFQALKTERVMMFVLLAMIMVVAAFAIVVTLIMMIMEKTSDIAILKTMGATEASIERIFAIEGTLIGVVGTLVGVVAGIAVTTRLSWIQQQIEGLTGVDTLPQSVYQFSTLPYRIDVGQMALVVALSMVLALGATLLPSRQGARLDPAEALRAE